MAKNLYSKIGDMTFDGLVTGISPETVVKAGTIRKLAAEATLTRGTILAKSSGTAGDDKLVVLGNTAASNETLTAYGILCDDVTVGTAADVNVPVYVMGCFALDKCTVKSDYTITEADKDALLANGIVFKNAQSV